MKTYKTARQVTSRLMHDDNAYYFRTLSNYAFDTWKEIINKHLEKCQHPFCKAVRGLEKSWHV